VTRTRVVLLKICTLVNLIAILAAHAMTSLGAQSIIPEPRAFKPETGIASWYGDKFHGRKTANGEVYDMLAMTAAHKTLPFGTLVLVTNLTDGRQVVVRINDRGPFIEGRIIDLSKAAAVHIGLDRTGIAQVRIMPAPMGSTAGPIPLGYGGESELRISTGPAISMPPATAALVVRIQVGSYKDPQHAGNAVASIAASGLKAVVETAGTFHRVAVYVLPEDKDKAVSLLVKAGWKDLLVKEIRR